MKGKKEKITVRWAMAGAAAVLIVLAAPLKGLILERWWLQQLGSDQFLERKAAAEKLADTGSLRAVPALMRLYEKEAKSCVVINLDFVQSSLEKIGRRNLPVLIKALEDPADELHGCAAVLLGLAGPAAGEAVPALMHALKDTDEKVREGAATALSSVGQAAVPALIKALKDDDPVVRDASTRIFFNLGREGKDAAPALIEALSDKDDDVRLSALGALREIVRDGGGEGAIPALKALLADENPSIRRKAAAFLSEIPGSGKEGSSSPPGKE